MVKHRRFDRVPGRIGGCFLAAIIGVSLMSCQNSAGTTVSAPAPPGSTPSATVVALAVEPVTPTATMIMSPPSPSPTVALSTTALPTRSTPSPTTLVVPSSTAHPGLTAIPIGASKPTQTRGTFALPQIDSPVDAATLENAAVDGVVVRTRWTTVEPTPNKFQWDFIDAGIAAAAAHGKRVILMVLAGAYSPNWALQNAATARFVSTYDVTRGQVILLPLPWDQTYLDRWIAFVGQLGQRYDSNPDVVMVPATGPTSISAEMSLPNAPDEIVQWRNLGYTPQKYVSAWDQTLAAYARAFPTTQIGVTLFPGLPIPNAAATVQIQTDITALAVAKYGKQATIQSSGLSAAKEDAPPLLGYRLVEKYSSTTTTGFELDTSATADPTRMGNADPVTAFRNSVDYALAAQISFLEIYEKDIANPDMQVDLRRTQKALSSQP